MSKAVTSKQLLLLERGLKTICFLLIAAGIFYALLTVTDGWSRLREVWPPFLSTRSLNRIAKKLGSLAGLFTIGAAGLWTVKTLFIQLKNRNMGIGQALKEPLMFLRKHHVLLGLTVLGLAFGHGTYFLVLLHGTGGKVYTGLAAFFLLAILAGAGVWLKFAAPKRKTVSSSRKIHAALALLFVIALLLHLSS